MTERKRKALRAEAKAWRVLARWCGTGDPDTRTYLCDRLSGRFDAPYYYTDCAPLPPRLPRPAMYERIMSHRAYGYGNLVVDEWTRYKDSSSRNHPRVIFCLLMALECEEEAND